MNYAIDACAIINLFNAQLLELAAQIPRCRLVITPIALGECSPACAAEVMRLQAQGLVTFLDDSLVPVERFLELVGQYDIGDGEVEAIAACEANGFGLCTDDNRARRLGGNLLGAEQVVGSLRLLRWLVEDGAQRCVEAFDGYRNMRERGGFLPRLEHDFFCDAVPA